MSLPKLQYIQKITIRGEMVELYQQFLLKLLTAQKELGNEIQWSVYENVFGRTGSSREFIFIRPLSSWADLDIISKESSISQVMADAFGEKEALQWMKIVQQSVKTITTSVLSKMEQYSLS